MNTRRLLPYLTYGFYFLAWALLAARSKINSDQFFHMRVGSEFGNPGWSWRESDHFSPFDSAEWQSTQPLSQSFLHWLESNFGLTSLMVLQVAVMVTLLAVIVYFCHKFYGLWPTLAILPPLTFIILLPGWFSIRPMQLSFILCFLVIASWWQANRSGKIPWWTLPLFAVWPLLHGMWIMGLAINFALALTLAITLLHRKIPFLLEAFGQRDAGKLKWTLLLHPILATAIILPQPFGVPASLDFSGRLSAASSFTEFRSPLESSLPFFITCAALSIAVAVGLIVRVMKKAQVNLLEWALVFMSIVFFGYMVRTIPLGALALILPATKTIHFFLFIKPPSRRALILTVLTPLMGFITLALIVGYRLPGANYDYGKWDEKFKEIPAETSIFSRDEASSYLLYAEPHLYVPVHSYVDAYTLEELEEGNKLLAATFEGSSLADWDSSLNEVKVEYGFVREDTGYGEKFEELGWTLIESDNTYELWKR